MLTPDQMMDFEDMINGLINQLQQDIEKVSADTAAVSPDKAIGRISRMDSILSQEVAKAAVARKHQRILDLHAARMRLDDGSFGICASCGEDIEIERLEAAPEVTFCQACANKRQGLRIEKTTILHGGINDTHCHPSECHYFTCMSAISQTIDHRLSQLPPPRAARLEHLILGLLDLVEPETSSEVTETDDKHRRAQALAALDRIAARGGIAGIDDPMAWQREQRADRPLPGREL